MMNISSYVDRAFKDLEFEEQAHVRRLVREGKLRFVKRETPGGGSRTYIAKPSEDE